MKRIIATYIKEWQLMRRDLGGLALLFLMPMLLIMIMALVQDGPFKDYKNRKFETLLLDLDHGKVALEIKKGLLASEQFTVVDSIDGKELDLVFVKEKIQSGTFQFAILIKKESVPKSLIAEILLRIKLVKKSVSLARFLIGKAETV